MAFAYLKAQMMSNRDASRTSSEEKVISSSMASFTIRNLDKNLMARLRTRAARHGRSLEDEVLEILRIALAQEGQAPGNLAEAIRRRFAAIGGFDLPTLERQSPREPVFPPDSE